MLSLSCFCESTHRRPETARKNQRDVQMANYATIPAVDSSTPLAHDSKAWTRIWRGSATNWPRSPSRSSWRRVPRRPDENRAPRRRSLHGSAWRRRSARTARCYHHGSKELFFIPSRHAVAAPHRLGRTARHRRFQQLVLRYLLSPGCSPRRPPPSRPGLFLD